MLSVRKLGWIGIFAAGLAAALLLPTTSLLAQRAESQGRGTRGAEPPKGPPVDPRQQARIDELLSKWEEKGNSIRTLQGKFVRYSYNDVFQTQEKDLGTFLYMAPDKGEYRVGGKMAEHWVCDGQNMYQLRHREKEATVVPLPPKLRGEGIRNGPLPFLFGMKADEVRRRYHLQIVDEDVEIQHEKARGVQLLALPLLQQDAANFSRADVILNAETYLPSAVKLYAPNQGKSRSVHVFYDVKQNVRLDESDFRPNLKGWKVTRSPETRTRQR